MLTSVWFSALGRNLHLCSFAVPDFWSSAQRSLIAVRELSLFTEGLMQRFLREPRVRCLRSSTFEALGESSLMAGGNLGRRSSLINWVSWECVREQ